MRFGFYAHQSQGYENNLAIILSKDVLKCFYFYFTVIHIKITSKEMMQLHFHGGKVNIFPLRIVCVCPLMKAC